MHGSVRTAAGEEARLLWVKESMSDKGRNSNSGLFTRNQVVKGQRHRSVVLVRYRLDKQPSLTYFI